VSEVWNYDVVNMSENMTWLQVVFSDKFQVEPAKEFEEGTANEGSCGIENDVIDVYGTKTNMKNKSHYKLGEFKRTADEKG
jgi:hypothetical protein